MVGGGRGALEIAHRFIERGRPVFLPFMGGLTGNSDLAFREILRTWDSHPVPGLSRGQFLQLAEPWVSGTGPLANLLRGTLAETPDIFISYRRSDAPAAAGRLAHDRGAFRPPAGLPRHPGHCPSRAWDQSIGGALGSACAGVIVIGRGWLASGASGAPRLMQDDDVVRGEIRARSSTARRCFRCWSKGDAAGCRGTARRPAPAAAFPGHLDRQRRLGGDHGPPGPRDRAGDARGRQPAARAGSSGPRRPDLAGAAGALVARRRRRSARP